MGSDKVIMNTLGILLISGLVLFGTSAFFDFPVKTGWVTDVVPQEITTVTQPGLGQVTGTGSGATPTNVVCGKDAAFNVIARDVEANTVAGTNVPVYLVRTPYNNPSEKQLVNPSGTALDPDGVAFSTGFATCDRVDAIAFNNTYYGEWMNGFTVGQGGTLELKVHRVAPAGSFQWILGSTNIFSSELPSAVNLTTMTSNAAKSLRKIEMRTNSTYTSYKLGSIYVDRTSTETNVSQIDLKGVPTASKSGVVINADKIWFPGKSGALSSGRQNQVDFQFNVQDSSGQPWLMKSNDYLDIVTNFFQVDGDGCSGGTDGLRVYTADVQNYVSRDGINIYEGTENDANSPADVGSGDTNSQIFYCTSGSGG